MRRAKFHQCIIWRTPRVCVSWCCSGAGNPRSQSYQLGHRCASSIILLCPRTNNLPPNFKRWSCWRSFPPAPTPPDTHPESGIGSIFESFITHRVVTRVDMHDRAVSCSISAATNKRVSFDAAATLTLKSEEWALYTHGGTAVIASGRNVTIKSGEHRPTQFAPSRRGSRHGRQ